MTENAFDGEVAPAAPAAFELRLLRWSVYVLMLVAGVWFALVLGTEGDTAKFLVARLMIPVWLLLAAAAAYYIHLVFRRFRLSLAAFIALIVIWGNVAGVTSAFAGWAAGLTVLLGLGAVLAHAVSWCGSVARFRNIRGAGARVGLFALAAAAPPAAAVFVLALAAGAYGIYLSDYPALGPSALAGLPAAAILAAYFRIDRRAKRAARQLLERSSVQSPGPKERMESH